MTAPDPDPRALAAQARQVAVVLLATPVIWIGLSFLGARLGWPARYAFLADFGAMAAFIWALVVTIRIWRKRQGN